MRACPLSASPELMSQARRASRACTARKSRPDAPGTLSVRHVRPPSVVRAQRPRVPLTQTTFGPAVLRPRSSASVPVTFGAHCAMAGAGNPSRIVMSNLSRMQRLQQRRPTALVDVEKRLLQSVEGGRKPGVPPKGKIEAEHRADEQGDTLHHVTMPRVPEEPYPQWNEKDSHE